jgi:rare lipoprotein A
MHAMTAAHKTMPLPSYARVRNPANGREIVVRVNDRGPFVSGRVIDLSYAAARKLGVAGIAPVEVERLTFEAIRTGAWRRGTPGAAPDAVAAGAPVLAPAPATPVAAPAPGAPIAAPPAADAASTATSASSELSGATAGEPAGPASDAIAPPPAASAEVAGFWVQLGAFRERGGAESFQQRVSAELEWLAPLMAVFSDAPLFRLQAGPYASLDEARGAAQRVREALRLVPLVIERR